LAKSSADGRLRTYALYSSSVSRRVSFYYATAAGPQGLHFPAAISDGRTHTLVLSVSDGAATLSVDGASVGVGKLQGPLLDCGSVAVDCVLFVGQRGSSNGGTLRFKGSMARLELYPASATGGGGGGE